MYSSKQASMTAIVLLLLMAFIGVVQVGAQTLVWSEEFNYTSAPDDEIWSYDLGNWGWGNAELQDYTSGTNNAWVDGSNLVIWARRSGNYFSSARIKTLDKLTFKYGTVEARISTPDLGDGLWPAFWTLGNDFPSAGWPACGEIDIMEMGIEGAVGAGKVNQRVGSHLHYDEGGYQHQGATYDMPSPINDTFVVYRMEWTPTSISTYINDIPIFTKNTSSIPEFNVPHFFILNMAVGGNYPQIWDPNLITAPFPAEYRCDWIRIYDNGHTVLGGRSQEQPPVPGTNLLVNAGFESGLNGWSSSLNGASASSSSAYARTDSSALVIDSGGAGGWASPNLYQSFSAGSGDVFNVKGYMLNPAGDPVAGGSFGLFKIEFRDAGGTILEPASVEIGSSAASPYYGADSAPRLDAGSATDTWLFSEARAEAPADTEEVRFVLLNVNEPGNPGPVYFDDVEATLLGFSNSPPVFTTNPIVAAAMENEFYTGATLAGEAMDPDGDDLSYSLAPGGPAWLNVAENGALSGTPGDADVGLNVWTVRVSDGVYAPVAATLEVMVVNVNDAPVFASDPLVMPAAFEGEAYSESLAGLASDVDDGDQLVFSLAPGGPAWLSVSTNGFLSGTPGYGDVGANNWTVRVSDGVAAPVEASLEIEVNARISGLSLLENAGFESGATEWDESLSGGAAAATWVHARGGLYSLMIDSSGAGDWASPNFSQSFSAAPGDVFSMRGYLLSAAEDPVSGNSFGLLKIEFRDGEGAVLDPASVEVGTAADAPYYGAESTPRLTAQSPTDVWSLSEVRAEAPAGTVTVGFYLLNVNEPGSAGPMYYDDIEVKWINAPVSPVTLSCSTHEGNMVISFPTQNGISYQLGAKTNLTDAAWEVVDSIAGDGGTNAFSFPVVQPVRFYNVLTP